MKITSITLFIFVSNQKLCCIIAYLYNYIEFDLTINVSACFKCYGITDDKKNVLRGEFMLRKLIKGLVAFSLSIGLISMGVSKSVQQVDAKESEHVPMELVYHEPIGLTYSDWANRALPIGNGEMGAKVFGGINYDRLQTNVKSLWTGGPKSVDSPNNGGNNPDSYKYVEQSRKLLEEGKYDEAKAIAERHLVGPYTREYGNYLPLSDVFFDFGFEDEEVTNYQRSLSLDDAISSISFEKNATQYTREFFVSYPDDVTVGKLTATGKDSLNFELEVESTEDRSKTPTSDNGVTEKLTGDNTTKISTVEANEDDMSIMLSGTIRDNGRKFASYLKITELEGEGATVTVKGNKLVISNATKVVFALNSKTDFEQRFPDYRKADYEPAIEVRSHVENLNKGYEELVESHLSDYQELYKRVDLNIGAQPENYDTHELLRNYKSGNNSNYLEALLFQYGRYMLIASSRDSDNSLPANLQGVWNAITNPAWNSDYHMNVNLQMNYWPAYITNIAETSIPLINYIDDMRDSGRIAAEAYGGIENIEGQENGWLAHTQNTPFGWTTPGWNYYWGWSPGANAWIMENVYEHYEFTQDKEYLETKIFPMLKETAKFWDSFLHYDKASDRYVSSPSYSPEHGPISIGNTFDQSLVAQLFIDYLTAAEVVGDTDTEFMESVRQKLSKLDPLIIGDDGQIKEWFEEGGYNKYEDGSNIPGTEAGHRHISQLVGLYPGKLFQEQKYLDAAEQTLNLRGDGGTGWSKANKINLWARLHDGDRAHKLFSELINNNILDNLWDTHAPYQADGNFGASSGVAEMLLQSHEDYIKPLIALPSAWNNGSVTGLVARGNYVFDMNWTDSKAESISITSRVGGELKVEYPNLQSATITVNGEVTDAKLIGNNRMIVNTSKNDVVSISFNSVLHAPKMLDVYRNEEGVHVSFEKIQNATEYRVLRTNLATDEVKSFVTQETKFIDDVQTGTYSYAVSVFNGNTVSELSSAMELIDVRFNYVLDDRDNRMKYSGEWSQTQNDGNYLKSESNSKAENSSVSFDIHGTGFELIGRKSPDLGSAKIYVDDKLVDDEVSFKGDSTRQASIFEISGLSKGKHQIKIDVLEKSISLDALKVTGNLELEGYITTYDNQEFVNKEVTEIPLTVKTTPEIGYRDYTFEIVEQLQGENAEIINDVFLKTNGGVGVVKLKATSKDNPSEIYEGRISYGVSTYEDIETLDDRDSRITYGSKWLEWNEGGRYANTEKYIDKMSTVTEDAKASLKFKGNKIVVYGIKSAGLGSLNYQIVDEKEPVVVNTNVPGATQLKAKLFEVEFDDAQERELIIYPEVNSKISLDYIEVINNVEGEIRDERDLNIVSNLIVHLEQLVDNGFEDLKVNVSKLSELTKESDEIVFHQVVKEAILAMNKAEVELFDIEYVNIEGVTVSGVKSASANTEVLVTVDNRSNQEYIPYITYGDEQYATLEMGSNTFVFTMPSENVKVILEIPNILDLSKLFELIDDIDNMELEGYTEESVNDLMFIRYKVFDLIGTVSTQDQVEQYIEWLNEAINSLVKKDTPIDPDKVDKQELEVLVKEAISKDLEIYTPESAKGLQDALDKAKSVLADENATQKEVDETTEKLRNAINNLVEKETPSIKVDKSSLENLIKEVEKLDLTNYTEISVENLEKVLAAAKSVVANDSATQVDVDSIILKLEEAVEALTEKPETPITPENPGSSENKPPTGMLDNSLLLVIVLSISSIVLIALKKRKRNI